MTGHRSLTGRLVVDRLPVIGDANAGSHGRPLIVPVVEHLAAIRVLRDERARCGF
jgi:hypothetical protein